MKNETFYRISWICLFLLISSTSAVEINLSGDVPLNITSKSIQSEYLNIYSRLAPGERKIHHPVNVYFLNKTEMKKRFSVLPEWAGGAVVGGNKIIIPLEPSNFLYNDIKQILVHELAHIAVERICSSDKVPRWFNEGIAMVMSGDIAFHEQSILSRGIIFGRLMPLDSIDYVNSFGVEKARIAYCLSRQAVIYIIDTWGMESLGMILKQTERIKDFEKGLFRVAGVSKKELERLILKNINRKFWSAWFFGETYLIWFGILILSFIAWVSVKIRKKKREEDDMDDPQDSLE